MAHREGLLTPEEEFQALRSRFGGNPKLVRQTVDYVNGRFFYSRQAAYRTERRGEVVFAVERPSGQFVVTRMKEYPDGIYRLPSGGICYGEAIVPALDREIYEELGIQTEVQKFLGIVRYTLRHGGDSADFTSYVFHVKEIGGNIMVDAQDDEISEYREVSAEDFRSVSRQLRSIDDSWRDWGTFRSIVVDFTADCMGV